MIRVLFIIFFISGCSKSLEEKKIEVDAAFENIKSLPQNDACPNLKAYSELLSLEKKYKSNFYTELSRKKIEFYDDKCRLEKEEAERERIKQIELSKLGKWSYGNYVDEFGDKTEKGYLNLTSKGLFSNTATTDSDLRVEMFLDYGEIKSPWFRIYEYDGNNPIKGVFGEYGSNKLICRVKSLSNDRFNINLDQYKGATSFRIVAGQDDALSKLNFLIKNEESIKFSCYDEQYQNSRYYFELNFKYRKNALRKLKSI